MKKPFLFILVTAMLIPAFAISDSIKIDINDIDKIVASPKQKVRADTVVEVLPISQNVIKVRNLEQMPRAVIPTDQAKREQRFSNPREEAREDFIKSLRDVIEKGKEFKYYFPNYDLQASKKEIEQMMRDAVSQ